MFEFVFGFDLVRAVKNKRREVDDMLQENIANLGYNCIGLLTFEERFTELRVDIVYILDIVKDSVDKRFSSGLWQQIHVANRSDPFLSCVETKFKWKLKSRHMISLKHRRGRNSFTYIVQVLEVVDKVFLCVNQLVNDFLALLFVRRYSIGNLLGY